MSLIAQTQDALPKTPATIPLDRIIQRSHHRRIAPGQFVGSRYSAACDKPAIRQALAIDSRCFYIITSTIDRRNPRPALRQDRQNLAVDKS